MAEHLDELAALGERWRDRGLLFVGGQGKSGTTWVEKLLDAHPAISCRGEGHLSDLLAPNLAGAIEAYQQGLDANNRRFPELPPFPLPDQREVDRLIRVAILGRMDRYAQATDRWVGERTPANADRIAAIARSFPDCAFVQVLRDPRDVAVSMWHHMQRIGDTGRWDGADAVAVDLAAGWASNTEGVRRVGSERLGERYRELRYEDLLEDPVAALTPLLEVLGVDAQAATVRRMAEQASFEALSGRARGEEDRGSHFRRGEVGTWRDALSAEAAARIWEQAGVAMAARGYER